MNLTDIVLVTENDKGTETNMLMTVDDYKRFVDIKDLSELSEQMLILGRTLGEADNYAEYYRTANVTVFARLCRYKMSRLNVQKILYKNVQLVCLF